MYKSILQFVEKDINEIGRMAGKILTGEVDSDDLSAEINERVSNLGNNLIAEIYEKMDELIRESEKRKEKWTIEQRNKPKTLVDIMGNISFHRTCYENKFTGESICLLDELLGFSPHQKITVGASARALEEAIMSSYSRGGERVSEFATISKQAMKKLVHETKVDIPIKELEVKKKIKWLHIVADEDHASAQFWNEKGDLKLGKNGQKINTIQPKAICLYEDVINESGEMSKSPRYKLIGKRYFSGVYHGRGNEDFWKEVLAYIEATYDTDYLERVYISGDGAGWIKMGCDVLDKSVFVLDRFHMMKYVNKSVAHLEDSIDDVKTEIWEALNDGDKKRLKEVYRMILANTVNENKKEEVKESLKYFLNHWEGINIRVIDAGGCWKCCAEGQVSHLLSARLSSRPMGWSVLGCDQMAKLRAFKWNGGKVIDLLKYKREKQKIEDYQKEQKELLEEVRKKYKGWCNESQLSVDIPGLERASMRWMKNLIDQAVS